MMTELSLNVLDVANNSIRAGASLIVINIDINTKEDTLSILIQDNGKGMTKEQLTQVEDPFFTTRTTRKVGLGVPFFKLSALAAEGTFEINSAPKKGTTVLATYRLSHIDRMPLGDINSTIHTLITLNPNIDFLYSYHYNENRFELDTREFRKIIGDIPFSTKEISTYIKEYLTENKQEVDGDHIL